MASLKVDFEFAIIVRAFQPGDVVILIPERRLTSEDVQRGESYLKDVETRTGVKFVLLPEPMRIAGREERVQEMRNVQTEGT